LSIIILFAVAIIYQSNQSDKKYKIEDNKIGGKIIIIQPLEKVEITKITNIYNTLSPVFDSVVIRNSLNIPNRFFYHKRKRYRSESIIKWLRTMANNNETIIGVTKNDISTTKGKYADYGVLGLGFLTGKACVISEYRLKDKSTLPIIAIHETGHTYGLQHCKVSGCYMMDAEGKDHTRRLKYFCTRCRKLLLE
jgi:archaemetzincin